MTDVSIVRRFRAPPEKLYAAWTRAELLLQWFGPDDGPVLLAEIDVEVGKGFHIVFDTRDGGRGECTGVYREIVPNQRLVFTWTWQSQPEPPSVITIELRPVPEGTEMTFTQSPVRDEVAQGHTDGWNGAFAKLDRVTGPHEVVSRDQWLVARKALLEREKAITRERDRLNAARRSLPWVRVDKAYVFDAPDGKVTLAELFGSNSQLIVKHFMMRPQSRHHCVGCSFELDNAMGALVHLAHHDVSYVVVAHAPIEEIEPFRARMGWDVRWVSAFHNDFNTDFHVSFPADAGTVEINFRDQPADGQREISGRSVFTRDERGIFHTYSSYLRGSEEILAANMLLDLTPNGRNEPHDLSDWVKLHDEY